MLTFDYSMELDFGSTAVMQERASGMTQTQCMTAPQPLAREHAFTLRCLPQESAAQHVEECSIRLEPDVPLSYGTDAFGTRYCWGIIHGGHERFRVRVTGQAERFPERHEAVTPQEEQLYLCDTKETTPGPVLRELDRKLRQQGQEEKKSCTRSAGTEDPAAGRDRAAAIRDLVFGSMTYTPGATAAFTSAEEAAARGHGVCQDYAHMMLALCRMEGIPARYTAGLLIGEGTSHAWVEISDGREWIPMDPTNPGVGWDEQLIFSHGRDARDCEINRGVYLGPGAQVQRVRAHLEK